MEFARETFRLDLPSEDGRTVREKLEFIGRAEDGPALPWAAAHVWEWFSELNTARHGTGFGVNPISWAELSAWSALTGRTLRPWEVRALRAVDGAYMAEMARRSNG